MKLVDIVKRFEAIRNSSPYMDSYPIPIHPNHKKECKKIDGKLFRILGRDMDGSHIYIDTSGEFAKEVIAPRRLEKQIVRRYEEAMEKRNAK